MLQFLFQISGFCRCFHIENSFLHILSNAPSIFQPKDTVWMNPKVQNGLRIESNEYRNPKHPVETIKRRAGAFFAGLQNFLCVDLKISLFSIALLSFRPSPFSRKKLESITTFMFRHPHHSDLQTSDFLLHFICFNGMSCSSRTSVQTAMHWMVLCVYVPTAIVFRSMELSCLICHLRLLSRL